MNTAWTSNQPWGTRSKAPTIGAHFDDGVHGVAPNNNSTLSNMCLLGVSIPEHPSDARRHRLDINEFEQ